MQQLTYTAPDRLEWLEADEPRLDSDRAALVRPLAVATCDLDALILAGESPFPAPFPIGHECVAEVIDAGDGAGSLAPGQLVSVPFQISCGECAPCLRGRTGNCESVDFMSTYGFGPAVGRWGGFLSDVVLVPYAEHMLVPLPDGLAPAAVASASDNISDAWRAVAPALADEPGAPVLVVGGASSGSIGLYAAALALVLGAASVTYVDADAARRATAESLGAETLALADAPQRLGPFPVTVDACAEPVGGARAGRAPAPPAVHEHGHLLRRTARAAAAGDVHQVHHVQDRPGARASGHAARARARRSRRVRARADHLAHRRLGRRRRGAARARLGQARDRALTATTSRSVTAGLARCRLSCCTR
jgi:alcohol dehydrogenase